MELARVPIKYKAPGNSIELHYRSRSKAEMVCPLIPSTKRRSAYTFAIPLHCTVLEHVLCFSTLAVKPPCWIIRIMTMPLDGRNSIFVAWALPWPNQSESTARPSPSLLGMDFGVCRVVSYLNAASLR